MQVQLVQQDQIKACKSGNFAHSSVLFQVKLKTWPNLVPQTFGNYLNMANLR